jgi:hypothetical protein
MNGLSTFIYFWPTYPGVLSLIVIIGLLSINVFLSILILTIYFNTPKKTIDDILLRIKKHLLPYFSESFERIEHNIRKTFILEMKHPIPKKSINIWHPHSLFAVTPTIHNIFKVTNPDYIPTKQVLHHYADYFPIARDIFRLGGTIPSTYSSIRKTLDHESVSIILGGAQELLSMNGTNYNFVIKSRSGIFKLALETGTPLVPFITYGEQELFIPLINQDLNRFIYKLTGTLLLLPTISTFMNWITLYNTSLTKIKSYSGKPISVKKIVSPTDKDIDTIRTEYIKAVEELFKETNPGGYTLTVS